MEKCFDHFIGQSLIKPGITGILVQESQRELYFRNHDEYVEFNFCPCCGENLKEEADFIINTGSRSEKLSLLIGTMIGQISELLNYMKRDEANIHRAYEGLYDIWNAASLQIHELYYKGNKP